MFRTVQPSLLILVVLGLASGSSAQAGDGAGIGVDLARVSRDATLAGTPLTASGSVAGVHAYLERGAWLRLAVTLQAGSVEYSTGGAQQSEAATRGDVSGTVGVDAMGTRLFAGLGAQRFASESPFGSGDRISESVYLPFGASRAGRIRPNWRARVRVEGRFVLAGSERFDSVTGVGDVDLSRRGGWGLEISSRLQHIEAPVTIEPYLRYVEPAATETATINGTAVRIDDIEQFAGGVRLAWRF